MRRPSRAVPPVAAAAPIAAFVCVGTTVPIEAWVSDVLIASGPFILLATLAALVEGSRLARTVVGVLVALWWGLLALALIPTLGDGQVGWFGLTTFTAIPILVAFTFGHAWGQRDIDERTNR